MLLRTQITNVYIDLQYGAQVGTFFLAYSICHTDEQIFVNYVCKLYQQQSKWKNAFPLAAEPTLVCFLQQWLV